MMRINRKTLFAGGTALLAIPLALQLAEQRAPAADHLDPPARTSPASDTTPDTAADIADIFAFQDGASTILVLTFAGPQATTEPAVYDRDVLYTMNLSNATPRTTANFPITFQFGQDMGANGSQFGIRVRNLPGVTGDITGPVETDLTKDGVRVRAGLFDDPFFFDLQGFRETTSTGTLSFDNSRDFFAGQTVSAAVIEIPTSRIANGSNPVDIWATTARFGGQL